LKKLIIHIFNSFMILCSYLLNNKTKIERVIAPRGTANLLKFFFKTFLAL